MTIAKVLRLRQLDVCRTTTPKTTIARIRESVLDSPMSVLVEIVKRFDTPPTIWAIDWTILRVKAGRWLAFLQCHKGSYGILLRVKQSIFQMQKDNDSKIYVSRRVYWPNNLNRVFRNGMRTDLGMHLMVILMSTLAAA
jgi:hypothetical protein